VYSRSVLFTRPPSWHSADSRCIKPQASLASWLYESGSLTARLRRACSTGFNVVLLRQNWDRPFAGEAQALNMAGHRHALVREVVLQCRNQPLVLARTIIPRSALNGAQGGLAHLGDRPLGELLFAYRGLRRDSLELARIDVPAWRHGLAGRLNIGTRVWGRRSVYAIAKGKLLVCEFFLPAILTLPEN
jgi:chorismate--pyruvate lyase